MYAYLRIFFAQIQEKTWPRIQQILKLRELFKNGFSWIHVLGGRSRPPQIHLWQGCIMDAYLRIFFAQVQEKTWPRIQQILKLRETFKNGFFLNSYFRGAKPPPLRFTSFKGASWIYASFFFANSEKNLTPNTWMYTWSCSFICWITCTEAAHVTFGFGVWIQKNFGWIQEIKIASVVLKKEDIKIFCLVGDW